MQGWPRRRRGSGGDPDTSLEAELERLRQENMRLRLECQRPLSLSAVVEALSTTTEEAGASGEDAGDEAYHVLAQAETARRAVLDALDGLCVAAAQMKRQLSLGVSVMEVDRRVIDRRAVRRTRADVPAQAPSNASRGWPVADDAALRSPLTEDVHGGFDCGGAPNGNGVHRVKDEEGVDA